MKLDINKQNFMDFIYIIELVKRNDLLICIPTFNSYDVTSKTIEEFYSQSYKKFDIMVIGASGDPEKLKERFPGINICVVNGNYGSSGNQLLNIFISQFYDYKYVMPNDNDAILLDKDGLSKMMENMTRNNLLATYPSISKNDFYKFATFHCAIYKVEMLKMMDHYFLPDYFLQFDDVAFFLNIKKYLGRTNLTEVKFYHPFKIDGMLKYSFMFFTLRSFLILILHERINFIDRLRSFRTIYYIFFVWVLYSVFNLDFVFFKVIGHALYQVVTKDYKLLKFPKEKFFYKKVNIVSEFEAEKFEFLSTLRLIFPQKYVKVRGLSEMEYYELHKNR